MSRAMVVRLFLALLLGWASAAGAQTFPKFTGLVVDAANVLPPETEADLTRKLEALQKDTKRQLVVATIPDLGGYPLEDYGYRLGRAWGVGLRDVNSGIILFIAPNEPAGHRGPRIEVGYGIEPIVTDALSSEINRTVMVPKLRAGDIGGAMEAGTDALIVQLRASPEEAKARTDAAIAAFDETHRRTQASGGGGGGVPVGLIFWGVVALFFILPMLRGRRRRGSAFGGGGGSGLGGGLGNVVLWGLANELGRRSSGGGSSWGGGGSSWSGGSSGGGSDGSWGGGGFTGGGGGSFGGGGASGDW